MCETWAEGEKNAFMSQGELFLESRKGILNGRPPKNDENMHIVG